MNFLLQNYNIVQEDEHLVYFEEIAIQKDRNQSIEYGKDYFDKYINYEGTPIARSLNENRTKITEKYCQTLLDIGIGSGEFIKSSKLKVYGFDINNYAIQWLKTNNLFLDPYNTSPDIDGWTFWDSLEHFPEPQNILTLVKPKQYVFISIPIFNNILNVKNSKHFRMNEHYYYFTIKGLTSYMECSGFKYIEHQDYEVKAGREGILAFVFLKT